MHWIWNDKVVSGVMLLADGLEFGGFERWREGGDIDNN
jgi:hypothetical protein